MRPLPRLLRYAPKAREGTLKLHFYLESIIGGDRKQGASLVFYSAGVESRRFYIHLLMVMF